MSIIGNNVIEAIANHGKKPRGSRAHQFTPREAAYSIAIDWLRNAHELRTDDIERMARGEHNAERYKREIKRQIAKLHDRLLRDSGMDGMNLSEE